METGTRVSLVFVSRDREDAGSRRTGSRKVSDADKRRFAEGPRVADAEPHRLRPVRIEVIGAVAHGATICRAVRSVKSERLIDIGAAAPASYPMARAQKVR